MLKSILNNWKIQHLISFLWVTLLGSIILYKPPLFLLYVFVSLISIYLLFQYPECFWGLFQSGLIGIFMFYSPVFASLGYWTLIPLIGLILYAFRRKIDFSLLINKLSLSQILFATWILLSLFHSTDLNYGIEKTKHFLSWNLLSLIGTMFFIEDFQRMRRAFYSFAIGVIPIGMSGYYFYQKGILSDPYRLGGFYMNAIWFGRIAGVASILIIGYLFLSSSKLRVKLVSIPVFIFLLFNMILSGTRGVLVAFIVTIFLMLSLKKRGFLSYILSLGLLVFLMFAIFRYVPEVYTKRYSAFTSRESIMALDRIPLMKSASQVFLNSPVIGEGAGSYQGYTGWNYPHNIFLEIAAELGIVGLGLFCFLIFQTFKYALLSILGFQHTDLQKKIMVLILCCFIFCLVEAQFSEDICGNYMIWFFSGFIYSIYYSNGFIRKEK